MKADIIIREAQDKDLPFILNSWLVSYYAGSELDDKMESAIYFKEQTFVIHKAMNSLHSHFFVACLPDHQNQILAWVNFNHLHSAINYIYVKHPYRKFGIASLLIAHCKKVGQAPELWATHYTRISKIVLPKWNLKYNPYILYESI